MGLQFSFRVDEDPLSTPFNAPPRIANQPGTVDLELPLAAPAAPNAAVLAFQRLEKLVMTTKTEILQSLTALSVKVAQNAALVDALKTANATTLAARDERIADLERQLAAASQTANQIPDDVVQGVASVDVALSSLKDHISAAATAPAPAPADIPKVGSI